MIIFIFIFIFILLLFYNINNKPKELIKKNDIIKNIKKKKITIVKNDFIMNHNTAVAFRGLSKSTKLLYKNELGGSKIFNKIKLDNKNQVNNIINYNKYSSYRTKPFRIIK
jgi:hypothetical protein